MQNLSPQAFNRLIDGARILEADQRGPRVYLTEQNQVIKLFPQKGLFSSNTLLPYASRFMKNGERLKQYGITSIRVEQIGRCADMKLHYAIYPLLPGVTLREAASQGTPLQSLLSGLPQYLCDLHRQGIFFKAFHLGNILQQDGGKLALIDIQSMHFYSRPVPLKHRIKNFCNCLHYEQDFALLQEFGFEAFFTDYLHCSGLNAVQKSTLLAKLRSSFSHTALDQALAHLQSSHPA